MLFTRQLGLLGSSMLALATLASSAAAEHSREALQMRRDSAGEALKRRSVNVLKIVEQTTAPEHAARLRKEVTASTGHDGWEVVVRNAYGRLNRTKPTEKSDRPVWSEGKRPVIGDLEADARAFVAKVLGAVVVRSAKDDIVPWRVVHEIQAAQSQTGESTRNLVSSTLEFARIVDGVPVLGGASKVSVTFAPNGEIVEASFDWPALVTEAPVATVGRDVMLERARAMATPTTSNVGQESVECGYVPIMRGAASSLEPACIVRYVQGTTQPVAWLRIVPLAEVVSRAPDWPEAQVLERQGAQTH